MSLWGRHQIFQLGGINSSQPNVSDDTVRQWMMNSSACGCLFLLSQLCLLILKRESPIFFSSPGCYFVLGSGAVKQIIQKRMTWHKYPPVLLSHFVLPWHSRACKSMRNGSGTTIQPWWRFWRSSRLSKCPPLCCSPSYPCCSLATTLSAPPLTCTQGRSTSPWLWSLTAPEVRTYNSSFWCLLLYGLSSSLLLIG